MKVDNFFTVIVVTGDGSYLVVEPPVEHKYCTAASIGGYS